MIKAYKIMEKTVKIDGSLGEGGGQVLRIALSLSALYNIPVEISSIRAGRPKPGLSAQHLKGVEIVRDMCNAKVEGAFIGSTRLKFLPGLLNKSHKREFYADIRTAGCVCLLAQVAVPLALFLPQSDRPVVLTLKGGTNVPMGPQIEYFTEVFKPWLKKFGGDFDFTVVRRGYYPKGGGEVHLTIRPISHLTAIEVLDPGNIKGITGWTYVAGSVPLHEAYQIVDRVKESLSEKFQQNNMRVPPINLEAYREDRGMAVGNGLGINTVCQTDFCTYGGSGLGSNRKDGPDPAHEAAEQIFQPIVNNSCLDENMQDQLVILMALAKGRSKIAIGSQRITQHTDTAIKVAEIMLKDRGLDFTVNIGTEGGHQATYIECQGCGLVNNA